MAVIGGDFFSTKTVFEKTRNVDESLHGVDETLLTGCSAVRSGSCVMHQICSGEFEELRGD
jgi:hypothetical protein